MGMLRPPSSFALPHRGSLFVAIALVTFCSHSALALEDGEPPDEPAPDMAIETGNAPQPVADPPAAPPSPTHPSAEKRPADDDKAPKRSGVQRRHDDRWIFFGIGASTMVPSLVPIPTDLEGAMTVFTEVRLLNVPLGDDGALFLRAKLSGSWAEGAAIYQPSPVPFDDTGGLAFSSDRYQVGPDLSAGVRFGNIEGAVDVGVRGGFDVGVSRYLGPRVAIEARYVFDFGTTIGLVYDAQHTISLGDVTPGWTSSASGIGFRIAYGF